ncbi:hypothetical protein ACH4Y0_37840 [Streptomyces sp. NPDC020707]|uniref:hypothetical protein n=1 Tax=Streptomyces sp. NPDC020707 TaxID=3365084 RepID=UPI0037892FDD
MDPTLKVLLYCVLALDVGKMLWNWLTHNVSRWITVGLRDVINDHPWWTGVTTAGGLTVLVAVLASVRGTSVDESYTAPSTSRHMRRPIRMY